MPNITTIEAHTAGEPLRVITGGYPDIPGATIIERRRYAREHLDRLRRMLMLEPRGHADMYGAIPVPPTTPDGHVGVLFMHNEGYSTMCGHGIIALVKVGLEHRLFEVDDERDIRIDTPVGRVRASCTRDGDRVTQVSFLNVPSYVETESLAVEVDGFGRVDCTIAFGGAFYAYVDADAMGLELAPSSNGELIDVGRRIKHAVMQVHTPRHPSGDPELQFLYGTIFVSPREAPVHSRNVCIFADGEVDRSPTGTGVSGRAAIHHARGELALGEWIEIESILGTSFGVRVAEIAQAGPFAAIVPEVRGQAHITGRAEFWLDETDPLGEGFLIR